MERRRRRRTGGQAVGAFVEMYWEFFRVSSDWWVENGNGVDDLKLRLIELLSENGAF